MQHIYVDVAAHATANLIDLNQGTFLLSGIEVRQPNRGQGHGGRLLKKVLNEADREQVTLLLLVEPDGTGLDTAQLTRWYTKHGFTVHPQDPHAMRRTPTSTSTTTERDPS